MEMLNAEKRLLHLVFLKPEVIKSVNAGMLYTTLASDIFNIAAKQITERALTSAINMTVAKSWYGDKYLPAVKNIFNQSIDMFDINIDLIHGILFDLEKEKSTFLNRLSLTKAIQLLDDGKLDEADYIVSSVKIKPIEKIRETEELIRGSLTNSRVFSSGTRLDDTIGLLRTKSMLAVAGEPGTMKTYFSMWYMLEILKKNPTYTALYFEKEMPDTDIGLRLYAYLLNYDMKSINDLLFGGRQEDLIKTYKEVINKDPDLKSLMERFIVIPDHKFDNPADIEKYIKMYKADIYCIDYIQQMIAESDMVKGTKTFITELKEITNSNDCFGILLSQVNDKEVARRSYRVAKHTDMQYGTVIVQNCSQIITLFYPHKIFEGVQPFTTERYKEWFYYTFAQKVRDAKSPKSVNFFEVMPNGFFKDINDTSKYKQMESWLERYKNEAMEKEKKSYGYKS